MQTSGPTAPSFASLGSTGTQLHQSFGNAGQQNNAYQSGAQANFAQQNVTAHSFGNSQPGATQISQPKVFHPQPVTQQAQPIQSRVPTASNPEATSLQSQATQATALPQFGGSLKAITAPQQQSLNPKPNLISGLASLQAASEAPTKKTAKKDDANFGLVLPLHKVKKLIKAEGDVKAISGEGSFAIARVTELFIEELVQRAYQRAADSGSDLHCIEYDDLSRVVKKWAATDFLLDIVPETMTLDQLTAMVERQDEANKAQNGTKAE